MLRNIHIWLPSYIRQKLSANYTPKTWPVHIIFCLADHFEPKWGRPAKEIENKRVDAWIEKYPKTAFKHRDSGGFYPKHTFFYPQEEYEKDHLDKLSSLCMQGLGEVEVHLHHDNDTAEGLRDKIESFKDRLAGHNLLSRDKWGDLRYAFIHGNWSLDNSRRDGRWCGVNNELEILKETGCYADFTLPSAPSDTQTRKINSIYYAKDAPKSKSHDMGVDAEVGRYPSGDLMIIQGPLALNWEKRKLRVFPHIENSEISSNNPPTGGRIGLWVDQRIAVKRKPEWIFIKIYTHGTQDKHIKNGYFDNLDFMFDYLEQNYNDGINYKLHYVTAREMYNIIKAAEAAEEDNPGEYRDYLLETNIDSLVGTYEK